METRYNCNRFFPLSVAELTFNQAAFILEPVFLVEIKVDFVITGCGCTTTISVPGQAVFKTCS